MPIGYGTPQHADCVEDVGGRFQWWRVEFDRLALARRPQSIHEHSKTGVIASFGFLKNFLDDLFSLPLCQMFQELRGPVLSVCPRTY